MKLKLHLLLFYPSIWYICDFFLFHIEIEGKGGWIIGGRGGGGKAMLALSHIIGGLPHLSPPPLPTPMLWQPTPKLPSTNDPLLGTLR